jgi:A/G-specific adenine glycosylase
MRSRNDLTFFRKVILEWFGQNRRDFPWRKEEISNYELILSEILLQRTKAETVSAYYSTFFKKYPSWEQLIKANISQLEQILKPLGLYKHRAKRLHNIILDYKSRNGIMPIDSDELRESKLSTLYISNAYELFILNKRAPLLDVNMSRVLSRFFYPQPFRDVRNDKFIQELANNVIDIKRCRDINWAILDLAALVCKKNKPLCNICKLNSHCKYYSILQRSDDRPGQPPQY